MLYSDDQIDPCIYRELKHCGKKFYFFYENENLLLTRKNKFEKLVLRKMNEWKIEKKFQPLILDTLDILLPMLFLTILGIFIFPKEK